MHSIRFVCLLVALSHVACQSDDTCPHLVTVEEANAEVTGEAVCAAIADDRTTYLESHDHLTYPASAPVSYCSLCGSQFQECGPARAADGSSLDDTLLRLAKAAQDGPSGRWCDELAALPKVTLDCRRLAYEGDSTSADCPVY